MITIELRSKIMSLGYNVGLLLLGDNHQTKKQASVLKIKYKVSTCSMITIELRSRLLSLGYNVRFTLARR